MIQSLQEWFSGWWQVDYWWLIGSLSLLTLVSSFIVLPIVIIRMAPDYFMAERDPRKSWARHHPVLRVLGLIGKNVLGVLLFTAGVIMCFTPGQGFLTMFMGLILMNFPGKTRLELWIIRRQAIRRPIDWIREKADQPPLRLPEEEPGEVQQGLLETTSRDQATRAI